jgi:hypothetical protein
MITSGLVLTLSSDPALAGQARTTLLQRAELTVGQQNLRWLPVVAEAHDVGASRDLHDWLSSLPGIDFVDVVHVDFEETKLDSTKEVAHEH